MKQSSTGNASFLLFPRNLRTVTMLGHCIAWYSSLIVVEFYFALHHLFAFGDTYVRLGRKKPRPLRIAAARG